MNDDSCALGRSKPQITRIKIKIIENGPSQKSMPKFFGDMPTMNIFGATIQQRSAIAARRMLAALCGALVALCSGALWAHSVEPPPAPLNAYFENNSVLIFTGRFNGLVFTSKSVGQKILSGSKVPRDELRFHAEGELAEAGQAFMEITGARLMAVGKGRAEFDGEKNCRHQRMYIPTQVGFDGVDESRDHYRSLLGQEVIMFLSPRGSAGGGSPDLSAPYYDLASGRNWRDRRFRPVNALDEVLAVAKKAKYTDYSGTPCNAP